MKIRSMLLIILGFIILLSSSIFSSLSYYKSRSALLEGIDAKLYSSAVFSSSLLAKDYHDNIADKDSVSRDSYLRIVDDYNKLCLKLDLQYLWSVLLMDDVIVFTSGTSTGKDVTKGDHALFFDVHTNPEVYKKAFESMEVQHSTFHDKWGEGRMVLVPSYDTHGRKYLFAASKQVSEISGLLRKMIFNFLFVTIVVSIAAFLLCFLLANTLSISINRLASFAEKISSGRLDCESHEKGIREIESLSKNLDKMRNNIRGKLAAIRASEEKFRALVETSCDWIWEVNAEGIYTYVSPQVESILGYTMKEVLGKTPFDLMPQDEAERVSRLFSALVEKGLPIHNLENIGIHKDGRLLTLETSGVPVFDNEGKVTGYRGIDRDVTSRKLANDEVERLAAVIKHSGELVNLSTPDGKMFFINDAGSAMLGIPRAKLKDHTIMEVISDKFKDTAANKLIPKLLSGLTWEGELQYLNIETGHLTDVHAMCFPIIDQVSGNPTYFVNVSRDITARKLVEKELKMAKERAEYVNEAKTEFLMNVSHDIRTPMNVINGFNDLLLKSPLNTEQQKFCSMIQRKGLDLIRLIEDIIDISALEKGKVRMHYSPLSLKELSDEIQESILVHIGSKKIIFSASVSKDVPRKLMGDSLRLKQVLENLCGNAVKYTDSGRIDLRISLTPKNEEDKGLIIRFEVEDTGFGIPQDKLPHIFEPYSRFYELGKSKEKEGVGMGLHIVQTLVKEMGGEITVKSEEGKGSTFSLELRMKEPGDSEIEKSVPKPIISTGTIDLSGMNILIAEDDDDSRELMTRALEDAKCILTFANNGVETLAELKEKKYDLVLMDLRMPRLDGFETTEAIRRDIDKKIPILALTAHVMDWVEGKCLEVGMNGYITKPVDITKLSKAIRKYVA